MHGYKMKKWNIPYKAGTPEYQREYQRLRKLEAGKTNGNDRALEKLITNDLVGRREASGDPGPGRREDLPDQGPKLSMRDEDLQRRVKEYVGLEFMPVLEEMKKLNTALLGIERALLKMTSLSKR